MHLIPADSYEELSERAAKIVEERVQAQPELVLGLATGSTPIGLYGRLVRAYQAGVIDFSQVKSFNLDEYCGLSAEHPQSYRFFMSEHLFSHVNIRAEKTFFPRCLPEACSAFEQRIVKAGGIDVQILGMGRNGHIGFNEPGSDFTSRTRVVELAAETIQANARFFESEDEVPKTAATMGLATIMEADEIILLVSGEGKQEAYQRMTEGPVTPEVPASILQQHENVTVLTDL